MIKLNALRKGFRRLVEFLPTQIRYPLYRSQLRIPQKFSDRLTIKLAETEIEFAGAFRVLHDSYVACGYMVPDPSGLRVTKYHALPSTSTLVALWDDKVVGVVSIIRDSPFGLPLEKSFDVSKFRADGLRPAEISSLAIDKNFRGNGGEVLLPLLKALWIYTSKQFGIDSMLVAVNPRMVQFFESILGFRKITEQVVEKYGFVNGAPAVGLYLKMSEARALFAKNFYLKSPEKDLYSFMLDPAEGGRNLPQISLPERKYYDISDPTMSPELFRKFFIELTQGFANFSEQEKKIVFQYYNDRANYSYHLQVGESASVFSNRFRRYDVNSSIKVFDGADEIIGRVYNISAGGILIATRTPLVAGSSHRCKVHIGPFEVVEVLVRVSWADPKGFSGLEVLEAGDAWGEVIAHLDRLFEGKIFRSPERIYGRNHIKTAA